MKEDRNNQNGIEKPLVQELPVPQLGMLMCLQKNMFCDVALQDMGYAILGAVIEKNPDFNDNVHYLDVTFEPKLHNSKWNDYEIKYMRVCDNSIADLYKEFDKTVDNAAVVMRDLVQKYSGIIIAGTLRVHMALNGNGTVTMGYLFVTKKRITKEEN